MILEGKETKNKRRKRKMTLRERIKEKVILRLWMNRLPFNENLVYEILDDINAPMEILDTTNKHTRFMNEVKKGLKLEYKNTQKQPKERGE